MTDFLGALDINNRDISLAIWISLIFIWAISQKAVRKSFANVLKALAARVILISWTVMLAYIALIVYLLYLSQIWEIGNLKDTVYWLFGSGFVFYLNINQIRREGYIRKAVVDSLKVLVLIEFIVNLYVFNIWVELILLVPILLLLGGLLGCASVYEKYKQVEGFLTTLLAIVGFGILVFVAVSIVYDIQGFFSLDNLRDFLIPILLTIGFVPFLYVCGLYSLYDSIFRRIGVFAENKRIALYAKLRTFLAFGLNLSSVRSWSREMGLLKLSEKTDIVEAIRKFRTEGA